MFMFSVRILDFNKISNLHSAIWLLNRNRLDFKPFHFSVSLSALGGGKMVD